MKKLFEVIQKYDSIRYVIILLVLCVISYLITQKYFFEFLDSKALTVFQFALGIISFFLTKLTAAKKEKKTKDEILKVVDEKDDAVKEHLLLQNTLLIESNFQLKEEIAEMKKNAPSEWKKNKERDDQNKRIEAQATF